MKSTSLHNQGLDASLENLLNVQRRGLSYRSVYLCVNSASILLHFPSIGYAGEGVEPRVPNHGVPGSHTEEDKS